MPNIKTKTEKTLSSLDLLKLESKMAQERIDAIKKRITAESETTKVPVVVQSC